MDPTGPIAQGFPLIARSRPPCTALSARVAALAALADRALQDNDLSAAAQVLNQAALIASDSGDAALARNWCHRHARAWLIHPTLDGRSARHALEPVVNLARLRIRGGDHAGAFTLLHRLYDAVLHRTDTTVEGITVHASALTATTDDHHDLTRWLWTVLLADGTRAHTAAGHWHKAETHLRQHNGIGNRMLDGRQVAVLAHATSGHHASALQMIAQTAPGDRWENAVTACLALLCRPPGTPSSRDRLDELVDHYQGIPDDPTLAVFRTRLGTSIVDAALPERRATARHLAATMARLVVETRDGHAAREVLHHSKAAEALTAMQRDATAVVVAESGVGRQISSQDRRTLDDAVANAEMAIGCALDEM